MAFVCTDVDECMNYPPICNNNADCINRPGTYQCQCKRGFSGDGFNCEEGKYCLVVGITLCKMYLEVVNIQEICGENSISGL